MKIKSRALVLKDNQILLMFRNKRGKVYFSVPGGGVEEIDSDLKEAAKREVLEETSIEITVSEEIFTCISPEDSQQHLFLASYVKGDPELQNDSVEVLKMHKEDQNIYVPMWVNIDQIEKLTIHPEPVGNFIKKYLLN